MLICISAQLMNLFLQCVHKWCSAHLSSISVCMCMLLMGFWFLCASLLAKIPLLASFILQPDTFYFLLGISTCWTLGEDIRWHPEDHCLQAGWKCMQPQWFPHSCLPFVSENSPTSKTAIQGNAMSEGNLQPPYFLLLPEQKQLLLTHKDIRMPPIISRNLIIQILVSPNFHSWKKSGSPTN